MKQRPSLGDNMAPVEFAQLFLFILVIFQLKCRATGTHPIFRLSLLPDVYEDVYAGSTFVLQQVAYV